MDYANLTKRMGFTLWAAPVGWWLINSELSLLPLSLRQILFTNPDMHLRPGMLTAVVLVFMAASEYFGMLSTTYRRNGFWLVYAWLGYRTLSYFNGNLNINATGPDLEYYVLLVLVAVESAVWGKDSGRWKRSSLLFSGAFFLSIVQYSLLGFFDDRFLGFFPPTGIHPMLSNPGLITILASVFFCDSAAFFAGSYWGKTHFSSISPKKTVEGSIAGLLTSVFFSTLGWYLCAADRYPLWMGIVMGLIIGVSAQAGDLLVSTMKRYFRVKDASNIIPGHGGILDRFDSLFFTAPVLSLYFILINRAMGN